MNLVYSVEALSTGGGRNGHVTTADGAIDFDMRHPKELGGTGEGFNPEQFFAAGYAACFHSALQGVARAEKKVITGSTVGARVEMLALDEGGFTLRVRLEVVLPDQPTDVAEHLVAEAHRICPYSNATRGNIEVVLTVSDDGHTGGRVTRHATRVTPRVARSAHVW